MKVTMTADDRIAIVTAVTDAVKLYIDERLRMEMSYLEGFIRRHIADMIVKDVHTLVREKIEKSILIRVDVEAKP